MVVILNQGAIESKIPPTGRTYLTHHSIPLDTPRKHSNLARGADGGTYQLYEQKEFPTNSSLDEGENSVEELYHHESIVIWSRDGQVVRAFDYSQQATGPIIQTLFASFPCYGFDKDASQNEQLVRAVCIVFLDIIRVHFVTGHMPITLPLPFRIANAWPLQPSGLIIQRLVISRQDLEDFPMFLSVSNLWEGFRTIDISPSKSTGRAAMKMKDDDKLIYIFNDHLLMLSWSESLSSINFWTYHWNPPISQSVGFEPIVTRSTAAAAAKKQSMYSLEFTEPLISPDVAGILRKKKHKQEVASLFLESSQFRREVGMKSIFEYNLVECEKIIKVLQVDDIFNNEFVALFYQLYDGSKKLSIFSLGVVGQGISGKLRIEHLFTLNDVLDAVRIIGIKMNGHDLLVMTKDSKLSIFYNLKEQRYLEIFISSTMLIPDIKGFKDAIANEFSINYGIDGSSSKRYRINLAPRCKLCRDCLEALSCVISNETFHDIITSYSEVLTIMLKERDDFTEWRALAALLLSKVDQTLEKLLALQDEINLSKKLTILEAKFGLDKDPAFQILCEPNEKPKTPLHDLCLTVDWLKNKACTFWSREELVQVVRVLNLIYEDMKLDQSNSLAMRNLLAPVIVYFCHVLGWNQWILAYRNDGYVYVDQRDLDVDQYTPPISFARHFLFNITGQVKPQLWYPDLVNELKLIPNEKICKRMKMLIPVLSKLQEATFTSQDEKKMSIFKEISMMLFKQNWNIEALKTFPSYIALALIYVLKRVQELPLNNEEEDYNLFIGRLDLFKQGLMQHNYEPPTEVYRRHLLPFNFPFDEMSRILDYTTPTDVQKFVSFDDQRPLDIDAWRQQYTDLLVNCTLSSAYGMIPLYLFTLSKIPEHQQQARTIDFRVVFSSNEVPLRPASLPDLSWTQFNQGIAAGTSLHPNCQMDYGRLELQRPDELSSFHAGLLLGLGLGGHLRQIQDWQIYEYLKKNHELTNAALLLGIAASHLGSKNVTILRILSLYSPVIPEYDFPNPFSICEDAATFGIGLLYAGTGNRRFVDLFLRAISVPLTMQTDKDLIRANSRLFSVSMGLGVMSAGLADSKPELLDLNIVTRLSTYYRQSFTTPWPLLGLGLAFMGTGNNAAAEMVQLPASRVELFAINPEFLLWRTLAFWLINMNKIKRSKAWIEDASRRLKWELAGRTKQAHASVITGACLAMGLKYAGTRDESAYGAIGYFVQIFEQELRESRHGRKTCEDLITRRLLRNRVNLLLMIMAVVMSGSGSLEMYQLLQRARFNFQPKPKPDPNYADFSVNSTCIGFLAMSGGSTTFSNTPLDIALILCSIITPNPWSNQQQQQERVFSYLMKPIWVLAVQNRCLLSINAEDATLVPKLELSLELVDSTVLTLKTPALIPPWDQIRAIHLATPHYYPHSIILTPEMRSNRRGILYVQARLLAGLDEKMVDFITPPRDVRLKNAMALLLKRQSGYLKECEYYGLIEEIGKLEKEGEREEAKQNLQMMLVMQEFGFFHSEENLAEVLWFIRLYLK